MPAAIEVVEFKSMVKGSLRGFATVRLGGITVHGFRVIQQEGQKAWVTPPQNEVKSTDGGKSKYFPIVELVDKIKDEVNRLVLIEYEKVAKPAQSNGGQYVDDDIPF